MNRKTLLLVQLAVYVILFLVLSAIAVYLFGKDRGTMMFETQSGTPIITETFDSVDEIRVSADSYTVEVVTHDSDQVVVEFYRTGFGTSNDPTFAQNGGQLSVTQPHAISIFLGICRIRITVPEDSRLTYDLKSTSGSVKLGATSADARLQSTSGSIKVYEPGETLYAKSTSGSVKVYEPFLDLEAQSTSGSVKVVADANSRSIGASSTSGSVKIALRSVQGYRMQHRTVSGSVKDEYSGNSYAKSGSANRGDESLQIDASSTSGSIKLCDWDD